MFYVAQTLVSPIPSSFAPKRGAVTVELMMKKYSKDTREGWRERAGEGGRAEGGGGEEWERGDGKRWRKREAEAGLRDKWGWRWSRGQGRTHFVHNLSRMNAHLCIHTMPRRSTSCFHLPGRHRVHQARRWGSGGGGSQRQREMCYRCCDEVEQDISWNHITRSQRGLAAEIRMRNAF